MLLFEKIPKLKGVVPHMDLMIAPTPVLKLDKLGEMLGVPHLYCKEDGLSGKVYGGNKVRKLEFLLAEALGKGAKRVLTFGAVGSNHAFATAVYAREVSLNTTALLTPQPRTKSCHDNLLCHTVLGTDLHYVTPENFREVKSKLMEAYKEEEGIYPYLIPPGGTSELGVLGLINGALELDAQIKEGVLPPPDVIYMAGGTFGSVAGVAIGLKIAKQNTLVRAIRVTDPKIWGEDRFHLLMNKTVDFLKKKGDFHLEDHSNPHVQVVNDYFGGGYAVETQELNEVMKLVKETEGLKLEVVYTAKPMAALVADAKKGLLKNKNVLFWKTNNSLDMTHMIERGNLEALPMNLIGYAKY